MRKQISIKTTLLILAGLASLSILWSSCQTTLRGMRPVSLGEININRDSLKNDVVQQMRFAWHQYFTHAKEYDELRPLTGTGYNWYGESVFATPINAFASLVTMGLTVEANQCKNHILTQLNFDKNIEVHHATMVDQILGGLLRAYQIDQDKQWLDLAQDLARRMQTVYLSPSGIPYKQVNLSSGAVSGEVVSPAEASTGLLEYGLLSLWTGDPVYYNRAKKSVKEVYNRKSKFDLIGSAINCRTLLWTNPESNILEEGGNWYANLYAASQMLNDAELLQMYQTNTNAAIKYLRESTGTGKWYEIANMNYGTQVYARYGIGGFSFPGLLAISGYVKEAEEIMESTTKYWMEYGIAPEMMDYKTKQIIGASYLLDPEAFASAYQLYKATSKDRYLQTSIAMYQSLIKFCRNSSGFASLRDVRTLEQMNEMPAHFFSGTLLYTYLLLDHTNNPISNAIPSANGYLFTK